MIEFFKTMRMFFGTGAVVSIIIYFALILAAGITLVHFIIKLW